MPPARAAIFDLDGVVTDTARVHALAWKATFDAFLRERLPAAPPFDARADYLAYVDGKPRYDGVRSFLGSRGVALPDGRSDDPPGAATVCGLGNLKDAAFNSVLSEGGVDVFGSTVALARALRGEGWRIGVASSSRNCRRILEIAGLGDLFEARVDGTTSAAEGLHGKPAPDIFLRCAALLGADPRASLVVEDAISGVQAGRAGGFGLVVGVDRGHGLDLAAHGAHVVVKDLSEIDVPRIQDLLRALPQP